VQVCNLVIWNLYDFVNWLCFFECRGLFICKEMAKLHCSRGSLVGPAAFGDNTLESSLEAILEIKEAVCDDQTSHIMLCASGWAYADVAPHQPGK
jgi:hypothetical protein